MYDHTKRIPVTRREALRRVGGGFGMMAFAGMLGESMARAGIGPDLATTGVSTANLDYHDGERYPTLVRVDGTPDYLDDITKPLTTPEKAPEEKRDASN